MSSERLAAPIERGGLGLIPFSVYCDAQKATFILRALQKKVSDGWVHALKEMFNWMRTREAWVFPVECLRKIPKYIEEDHRTILVNMITIWSKLKLHFDNIGYDYLGRLSAKGTILVVLQVISSGKRTKRVKMLERAGGAGKLRKPDPFISHVNNFDVIPVKVEQIDGNHYLLGNENRKTLLSRCTLPNGRLLNDAAFSDISESLIPSSTTLTPKQQIWEKAFPGFMKNFEILAKLKIRMRLKSHIFNRYSNMLPRDRRSNCPLCSTTPESSDHVLFQCKNLREQARLILEALERTLKVQLLLDSFLMILHTDERIRIFQIAFLYNHWIVRCKIKHSEHTHHDQLRTSLLNEIKKYILRMHQDKQPLDHFQPLIENFDTTTLNLSLVDFFKPK
jgi:hypothetical protein